MAENEIVEPAVEADGVEETPDIAQAENADDAQPETSVESVEGESSNVETETSANTPAPTTSREFAAQGELVDALSSSGEEAAGEEKEVENGRNYEMVYISRVGDGEATENTAKSLRALIEGAEGAIDHVRTSETRRLAYPIGGEIEGVYVVANGRFAPTHIGEVDRFFKLQENVIRHMILRQDD